MKTSQIEHYKKRMGKRSHYADSRTVRSLSQNIRYGIAPDVYLHQQSVSFHKDTEPVRAHETNLTSYHYQFKFKKAERSHFGTDELTSLFSAWQNAPSIGLDKQVHEKVFSKLITIITHNDDSCETINKECASTALFIGSLLSTISLLPARISKSTEGSISFEFETPNLFTSLEVFNDGEIVFLQDKAGNISACNLEKDQIAETLHKIG